MTTDQVGAPGPGQWVKEALGKDEKAEAAARKVNKSSIKISPLVIKFRSSVSRSFN